MAKRPNSGMACEAEHSCSCSSGSLRADIPRKPAWKRYFPALISFILLAVGIAVDHFSCNEFFSGYVRLAWYLAAYIPVGLPVIVSAVKTTGRKDFFNEFTLMTVATVGAFFIGEYPEGVAVMLFYCVGELFQESAVSKAQRNIKALLDVRPDSANVSRDGKFVNAPPETIGIGEIIQVKAGERVPLDGRMLSPYASFNTSALTGESLPKTICEGESVLAGMINLEKVVEIEVEKVYQDSSLARILDMVQNAASRKAKTELLIRKFARIYTPIVFFLAVAITLVPYFFAGQYIFADWLYRALVFLVISCPCALVVSVPLGYFGGIGAASRNGILFKGANYIDMMTKVNTVVMDKTGTLTEGTFEVRDIVPAAADAKTVTGYAAALESRSNHPIAKAIVRYAGDARIPEAGNVEETAGRGLKGTVEDHEVLAGNGRLMSSHGILYDNNTDTSPETVVIVSIDGIYAGHIIISDRIKADSAEAVDGMRRHGIKHIVMLSGDKSSLTKDIADRLGIDEAYGDLLPEDKVAHMEKIKADPSNIVAFVGDGINDAPVLALSDVGIAMGGMGSDAAIEVADMVIQTDQPSKIPTAIRISKATRRIVIQNIVFALSVKGIVLLLGAFGVATMWEAVFADVGVSLLAILNSLRILRKKF